MTAIKRERKARNLSHDKLSALSGVSRQAISKIESGERNPTMLTVYKLISALDLTFDEFADKL